MIKNFEDLPQFWQGVVTSIVAAIIFSISVYLLRLVSRQSREWFQTRSQRRKRQIDQLRTHLDSSDSAQRNEAYLFLTFSTLKYLFIGNILWVLPEALSIFGLWPVMFAMKVASSIFFILGLRWIFLYYTIRPSKAYILVPSKDDRNDENLVTHLKGSKWEFPKKGILTLKADGTVHKSWGRLTPSWAVHHGKLHYEKKIFEFTNDFTEMKEVTGIEFFAPGKRLD